MNTIKTTGVKVYSEEFGTYYTDIGIKQEVAELWGKQPEDVEDIEFKISDNQSAPNWDAQEYWGWIYKDSDMVTNIQPNYKMFHVCFPYGVKGWEEDGVGKSYRLDLVMR